MNNTYLYSQMFWTMSVCISSWVCKGGEMKFHVPLKSIGFVYWTLLGCASNPVSYSSFSEEGWNLISKVFVTFSVFALKGRKKSLTRGDALSVAVNRKDKHCSKMKEPFQFSPRFIIKDFVLKLKFGFFVVFFPSKELCLEAAALIYCNSCDLCLNFISAMKSRMSWNSCSFAESFPASTNQVDISVKYFKYLEGFLVVKLVVQISKIAFCPRPIQDC